MASEQTTELPRERTPHGIRWGVTDVSCACEHRGHIVLHVTTPRQRLSVRVTPSGLIRVDAVEPNTGEPLHVAV